MAQENKPSVPVFTIEKKHAWRDILLRWVGLALVLIVLLGTVVWYLVASNFSFEKTFESLVERLKPEVKKEQKIEVTRPEQELSALIEKDKVIEIESLKRTSEGDLTVKAKSGPVIIFAIEKSLTDQVATLQTLLTKAKIDNKALKKVDFRFEKIVVEY